MQSLALLSFVALTVSGSVVRRDAMPAYIRRQLPSNAPQCGVACMNTKITEAAGWYGQNSFTYYCAQPNFLQAYNQCVNDHCTGNDVTAAISAGTTVCSSVVNLAESSSAAGSPMTTTASDASSATETASTAPIIASAVSSAAESVSSRVSSAVSSVVSSVASSVASSVVSSATAVAASGVSSVVSRASSVGSAVSAATASAAASASSAAASTAAASVNKVGSSLIGFVLAAVGVGVVGL